jgi:hypothetical protein
MCLLAVGEIQMAQSIDRATMQVYVRMCTAEGVGHIRAPRCMLWTDRGQEWRVVVTHTHTHTLSLTHSHSLRSNHTKEFASLLQQWRQQSLTSMVTVHARTERRRGNSRPWSAWPPPILALLSAAPKIQVSPSFEWFASLALLLSQFVFTGGILHTHKASCSWWAVQHCV